MIFYDKYYLSALIIIIIFSLRQKKAISCLDFQAFQALKKHLVLYITSSAREGHHEHALTH